VCAVKGRGVRERDREWGVNLIQRDDPLESDRVREAHCYRRKTVEVKQGMEAASCKLIS
jgi:hypothetical protein